jgi:hypothetical protein
MFHGSWNMTNESERTNDTHGNATDFIGRVKAYKEFIAILVFFVSGFMWIFFFFATKGQVKVNKCLTNQNITLIESRLQKQIFLDELTQKSMALRELEKKDDISKEEDKKVIQLKSEIELIKADLKNTKARYNEAFNFLKAGKCLNR